MKNRLMVFDWVKAAEYMALLVNRDYVKIEAGLGESWDLSSVLLWESHNGIIYRSDKTKNPRQGNLISMKETPGIRALHKDGITKVWYPCYEWREDNFFFDWPDWAIDIFRFKLSEYEEKKCQET